MGKITYRTIINEFGKERQCRQAMEECAELIQAINKAVRFPDDPVRRVDLMEEIADVKLMIIQLEEIFDIDWKDEIQMFKYKRDRLFRRYLEEVQKKGRRQ